MRFLQDGETDTVAESVCVEDWESISGCFSLHWEWRKEQVDIRSQQCFWQTHHQTKRKTQDERFLTAEPQSEITVTENIRQGEKKTALNGHTLSSPQTAEQWRMTYELQIWNTLMTNKTLLWSPLNGQERVCDDITFFSTVSC